MIQIGFLFVCFVPSPPLIFFQGDSGSPLVCLAGSGSSHWVVLGITSWGKGCGRGWGNNSSRHPSRRGSPGLFTDVRLLLPWIKWKLRHSKLRWGLHKMHLALRSLEVVAPSHLIHCKQDFFGVLFFLKEELKQVKKQKICEYLRIHCLYTTQRMLYHNIYVMWQWTFPHE